MVAGWMRSADHRENVLDGTFEDLGLGLEESDSGRSVYYVADFGTRSPVETATTQKQRPARRRAKRSRRKHTRHTARRTRDIERSHWVVVTG
jgi:hypothetical protein